MNRRSFVGLFRFAPLAAAPLLAVLAIALAKPKVAGPVDKLSLDTDGNLVVRGKCTFTNKPLGYKPEPPPASGGLISITSEYGDVTIQPGSQA